MACLCFVGPEFIFQLAIGQWASARRSVAEFRKSGYNDWTMSHAFLADMGGFLLHPDLSPGQEWANFPIDAKQVHYLVTKGYLPYEAVHLDKRAIADRNKVDGLARLITVMQILWFCVACIARAAQGLLITALELTTMGFIICTLGTFFFWFHKPLDIGHAIALKPNATIKDILLEGGENARQPYRNTPLDFVGQDEYSWNLYYRYWMNWLRVINIEFRTFKRPIDKFSDDQFYSMPAGALAILFFFQTGYAAVEISGWNFHFPTHTEAVLWHIATLNIIISICIYWLVDITCFQLLPEIKTRWLVHSTPSDPLKTHNSGSIASIILTKLSSAACQLRNNSRGHDPAYTVPLKALIPATIAASTYILARGYIIIESFINLRALPSSAYDSVDWVAFMPHL
ncbi:hypothetical protein MMC14_003465 [Varicellaria rhodocarpa]|nr:hypothetical protein [Varicellaria rhodocarpa]